MKLDFDDCTCLIVDKRYEADRPRIEGLLAPYGLRPRFFLDGDGVTLDRHLYDQTTLTPPAPWRFGQGAYQHFRAMQEVVRRAKAAGRRSLLWVEDDLILGENFGDLLEHAELPPDWDIFYFGANHSKAHVEGAGDHIIRVKGSLTTHMVAFRDTVFDAILALRPTAVIDELIARVLHPRYRTYALWPNEARQRAGLSHLWGVRVDYSKEFDYPGNPWG